MAKISPCQLRQAIAGTTSRSRDGYYLGSGRCPVPIDIHVFLDRFGLVGRDDACATVRGLLLPGGGRRQTVSTRTIVLSIGSNPR